MGLFTRSEDGGLSRGAEAAFVAVPTVISLGIIAVLKGLQHLQNNSNVFANPSAQPTLGEAEISSSAQPVAGLPEYN